MKLFLFSCFRHFKRSFSASGGERQSQARYVDTEVLRNIFQSLQSCFELAKLIPDSRSYRVGTWYQRLWEPLSQKCCISPRTMLGTALSMGVGFSLALESSATQLVSLSSGVAEVVGLHEIIRGCGSLSLIFYIPGVQMPMADVAGVDHVTPKSQPAGGWDAETHPSFYGCDQMLCFFPSAHRSVSRGENSQGRMSMFGEFHFKKEIIIL